MAADTACPSHLAIEAYTAARRNGRSATAALTIAEFQIARRGTTAHVLLARHVANDMRRARLS